MEIKLTNKTKKKIEWLSKFKNKSESQIIKEALDIFYNLEKTTEKVLGGTI